MLELLIVGILQAVAGMPESPPPPAAAETGSISAAESHAPALAAEEAAPPAPVQMRRERVCTEIAISGRRLPQRVCRTVMVPVEPERAQEE